MVISGRNLDWLSEVAAELALSGRQVIPVQFDIRDSEGIKALVDQAIGAFGKIDFLFNNAGTIHREPSDQHDPAAWNEVLQVNLSGPFLLSQAVARTMIERNIKGKIINTSSLIAVLGGSTVSSYAASKGGLTQLTNAMCNDFGAYGINVNAIVPGWVKTELTDALQQNQERYSNITARIPLGRT